MLDNSADHAFASKVMAALKETHIELILSGNYNFGNNLTAQHLLMKVYSHTEFGELTTQLKSKSRQEWMSKHSLIPSDLDLRIESLSII